jgi:hypothetical protein
VVQALNTKQRLCTTIRLHEHYRTSCPPWRIEASRTGNDAGRKPQSSLRLTCLEKLGTNARLIISTNRGIRVRRLRSRSPIYNPHNRLCHPSALSLGDTEHPMSAMMKSRRCSRHSRIRLREGSMPLLQGAHHQIPLDSVYVRFGSTLGAEM